MPPGHGRPGRPTFMWEQPDLLLNRPGPKVSLTGTQRRPMASAVRDMQEEAMRATARTPRRSRARASEKAMMTAAPLRLSTSRLNHPEEAPGKSVSWTGRERLRCLWYRLRLTVQEMNYAARRIVELQMRLLMTPATGRDAG